MDRRSEEIIGQIVNPTPTAGAESDAGAGATAEPIDIVQIVSPQSPNPGVYMGPERRAKGYLIAEVVEEPEPVDPSRPSDSLL